MELDYKAIGKRIKIARIKADLTQEALAEKASLSTTHMSNIETGNSKLSLPTIVSLANALSVSVDEFLCDSVIHSKDIFSQEIQDLVSDCDDVPSQQKWTQKSFKKRIESYSFFCFRKTAAFIPRFA